MYKRRQRLFPLLWLLIVILVLAFWVGSCWAEEVNVDIIIQIESGGDPNAYNKKSGAIGLMQITPIVLEEWFNYGHDITFLVSPNAPIEKYNEKNMLYSGAINRTIGTWYLNTRVPQLLKKIMKSPFPSQSFLAWAMVFKQACLGVVCL